MANDHGPSTAGAVPPPPPRGWSAPSVPPPPAPDAPERSRRWPIALVVAIVVVLVAGLCFGLYLIGALIQAFTATPGVSFAPPSTVISTQAYGLTPPDQLWVALKSGEKRSAAEKVADELGGEVVGEVADVGLYQIRTDATDEAGLSAALETAHANDAVESAFPDQNAALEVAGVQCSPLADGFYASEAGRLHQIIGTQRAWDVVRAAGIPLSPVKVAVLDTPLYRETGEYDGKPKVVTSNYEDQLIGPAARDDGSPVPYGSHGNGVTNLIAADPDNGGVAGIASVMGDKLEVDVVNIYGISYGRDEQVPSSSVATDDPAVMKDAEPGFSSSMGKLVAMQKQIKAGAKIINCSWGINDATPELAAAYKRYVEYSAKNHPDVLFVCSAGNTGTRLDGSRRAPSGLALPNMITVGNVNADGTTAASSSRAGGNYEITLAAPASGIALGVDDQGALATDTGTSFAAAQVTAAAALLRGLDPRLSAGDIKQLLATSAVPGVTAADGMTSHPVDAEVGGRVLAVDRAVESLVAKLRADKGLPPLDSDTLGASRIDLSAEKNAEGVWVVTATAPDAPKGGTDLELTPGGSGSVGGKTVQRVSAGKAAKWTVTVSDDRMAVHVTRSDTGVCWRVVLDRTEATLPSDPEAGDAGTTPEPEASSPDAAPTEGQLEAGMTGDWYYEVPKNAARSYSVELEMSVAQDGTVTGTCDYGVFGRLTGTVRGSATADGKLVADMLPDNGRPDDRFQLLGTWDGKQWVVAPSHMLNWQMEMKRR